MACVYCSSPDKLSTPSAFQSAMDEIREAAAKLLSVPHDNVVAMTPDTALQEAAKVWLAVHARSTSLDQYRDILSKIGRI